MGDRVTVGGLQVAPVLHAFVRDEALPGTGVDEDAFWAGVEAILGDFAPRNRELLARRDELQQQLDEWHEKNPGPVRDQAAYVQLLRDLGYLVDEPADFTIETSDVDGEVAVQAGPQLVVPVLNARFAANAANARWGSLYDALYGTDALPEDDGQERGSSYNPKRGAAVIATARAFLDEHFPLEQGSHADATGYSTEDGGLTVLLGDGGSGLADPSQYVGHRGDPADPEGVLLVHHGLHVEIQVDRSDNIGKDDAAGVKDLLMEAAVSTIMDLEDSVAAVDPDDKVAGYRNWLLLNQGTLTAEVAKGGSTFTRGLEQDRLYDGPTGQLVLPGRSLLFVRQVGHLMTTDAILVGAGDGAEEVPEGILDAIMTALCSLVDIQGRSERTNSRTGSMYAVKPKMHGPDEVRFTDDLFAAVEDLLGLGRGTIKLGIMDEERRTSANLKACIHAARGRVAFINTGFLDRTGDELHTSMLGGAMIRKGDMKSTEWIKAYEDQNVDIGLACGLQGKAQIGKGMWAMPDEMAAMLEQKIGHPQAGASCAWVPVADRGDPARAALPPGRRRGPAAGAHCCPGARSAYDDRGAAHRPAGRPALVERRGQDRGDREQPAGHPRLREALDRRRRRLLEGARHPRHRADGGPRHLSDLLPARRELAAARHRHHRRGRGGVPPDGRRGRRAAGGRRLPADGSVVRRRGVRRRARPGLRGAHPALGLHRADPAPPPTSRER